MKTYLTLDTPLRVVKAGSTKYLARSFRSLCDIYGSAIPTQREDFDDDGSAFAEPCPHCTYGQPEAAPGRRCTTCNGHGAVYILDDKPDMQRPHNLGGDYHDL